MLNYLNQRNGAVILSIISNTTLILLKLAIGLYTGSVSILSEAIHSSTDLLAAIIAFFAIRTAVRPADANHPYGHGKAESLAATAEALLIFLAAGLIVYEAAQRLIHGAVIENVEWGIGVMAFSATANFLVSRHLFNVAQRTGSPALAADAWHLATDLYTALGVGLGLVVVRLTGIKAFDPLVAIGVALFIVRAAWNITRGAMADLLDESLPESDMAKIRALLAAHREEYSNVRVLRARRAGGGRRIYIALEFPPSVSMADAHTVAEQLEREIQKAFPGSSVIVEAEAPSRPETPETVREAVERVARRLDLPVHHINVYAAHHHFDVALHVEVDESLSLDQAHNLATRLEEELRRELPELARVDTHIEPTTRADLPDDEQLRARTRVETVLREMEEDLPAVRGVHDVEVRRNDGKLNVSLHLALSGAVPIAEAHYLSSEIEARLKRQVPNIQSVLVHTEPRE
jgi:cation diffusion facilitator family transporter